MAPLKLFKFGDLKAAVYAFYLPHQQCHITDDLEQTLKVISATLKYSKDHISNMCCIIWS